MGRGMKLLHFSTSEIKHYIKDRIPSRLLTRIQAYHKELRIIKGSYHMNLNHGEVLSPLVMLIRISSVTGHLVDRKWILFYPDNPIPASVMHKLCLLKGYGMTNDPGKKHIMSFKWRTETYYEVDDTLTQIRQNETVLNIGSLDISKSFVTEKFEEVFGYPLAIDPLTFQGKCLCKSETNALHDGFIVECPIEKKQEGYVYQKLINNEYDDEWLLDIRTPVFLGEIPFVYHNYRHRSNRFKRGRLETEIVETNEVLTIDELEKIKKFCKCIHMDYGELDVLRDRFDGKIYIVDANNTPAGPPKSLPDIHKKKALVRISQAFEKYFLRNTSLHTSSTPKMISS